MNGNFLMPGNFMGILNNNSKFIAFLSILIFLGFIFSIIRLLNRKNAFGVNLQALVLRKLIIDKSPSAETIVEIRGRRQGIINWILTLIRINPEITFLVTNQEVAYFTSNLFYEINTNIPLSRISSTHSGFIKPIGYLILGSFLILVGLITGATFRGGIGTSVLFFLVIIGIISLILYWLRKKIIISVKTFSGLSVGVAFKRSIIENVSIDINQAREIINIINHKILTSSIDSPIRSANNSKISMDNNSSNEIKKCPNCGKENNSSNTFCQYCGAKI